MTPEERDELDAAEVRELLADKAAEGEAAQLRALLASSDRTSRYGRERWQDLSEEGCELAGFETVSVEEGDESRWYRFMHAVTRAPSGKHYLWTFQRGLTEYQDSEYFDVAPQLVERHEETRVVVTWKAVL